MFDLDSVAIDHKVASGGKWVEFMNGRFLVARWNNRKAENLRNELHMEFYSELSKLGEGKMPDDLEDKFATIQARIMAETVLLGWENVGQKGKELKFSPETALKVLSNPAYVDLYQFIQNESIKRENFVAQSTEKVVKDVKLSADS